MTAIELLKKTIAHFWIGIGYYSHSLIITSDFSSEEFRSVWENERKTFLLENPDYPLRHREVLFDSEVSPRHLYEFLKVNKSSIILFDAESAVQILKSNACLRIIEGAVCSSPDSGEKWSVSYDREQTFIFDGYIIMNIKKGDINWTLEKYQYLIRDGIAILDLDNAARKYDAFAKK